MFFSDKSFIENEKSENADFNLAEITRIFTRA